MWGELRGFQGLGFREFPKLGVPFRGPYSKDCSILGSILGSPYLRIRV